MVDWPIFIIGLVAVSLVMTAVRAISREDAAARKSTTDRGNAT
jgi:hypothetical protein